MRCRHIRRADLIARFWPRPCHPTASKSGRRCLPVEERGERVQLDCADGGTAEADLVIGADGIRSPVRQAPLGPELPRLTGNGTYRGLAPTERVARLLPAALGRYET